jgi:hypothetical protein
VKRYTVGNCNYGGVLIIWDKIFGTYEPEVVRKDYFGLAAQPETFNPLLLNFQHFFRMNSNINGKSLGGILFSKRATHQLKLNLSELLTPLPPMSPSSSTFSSSSWSIPIFQQRIKFNGFVPMHPITVLMNVLLGFLSIGLSYSVLVGSVLKVIGWKQTICLVCYCFTFIIVLSTVATSGEFGSEIKAFLALSCALVLAILQQPEYFSLL